MTRKNTNEHSAAQLPVTTTSTGFGMPHALVILGFLTAAVVLRLAARASVQDTIVLLGVAGGVSVVVLLAAGYHHGQARRRLLRRLLNAALMPGSGN
ncbi:hypothetical protein ACNPQM_35950 [Streptomyces sp. NPDC056231]|uniref:hypothetical protein n=1 Tax=Streptomyces sp. NPDC056231 TaxID=3345755 RepID=UPI003AAC3688